MTGPAEALGPNRNGLPTDADGDQDSANMDIRRSQMVSGRLLLTIGPDCGWDDFTDRADEIVRHFGMRVVEQTDSLYVRTWVTAIGDARFYIVWDAWDSYVGVLASQDTPDEALEALLRHP